MTISAGDSVVEVTSREHLWEIISNWDIGTMPEGYKYTMARVHLASLEQLADRKSQALITRYSYCKNMHAPAFAGHVGEYPAWWLDAVAVIDSNLSAAQEYKDKLAADNNKN